MIELQLSNICRPSVPLTKFIEIIGILIGAQSKNQRSKYKTALPSNYSDTVHLLNQNFVDVVEYLSQLKDEDVGNEMASQIYSKTREEGFNYQKACEDGGEELSNLFSSIKRIILAIDLRSTSSSSLSVRGTNLIVAITNDKSSYAVFDAAAHILGKY